MNKPIQLRPVDAPVYAGVVELLEEMLEMARKGEIDGVAVAATSPQGVTRQAYDRGGQPGAFLYMSIGHLQAAILNTCEDVD